MGLVLAVDLVDGLLNVEAPVDDGEYLREAQRVDEQLSLGLLDRVVLRLELQVNLGLLLDVEEVGGHHLPQRVDCLSGCLHSMLEPCLKTKN